MGPCSLPKGYALTTCQQLLHVYQTASSLFDATFDVFFRPPPPLEDGGHSETESEAAVDKLDKEYWIRRAGEVSVMGSNGIGLADIFLLLSLLASLSLFLSQLSVQLQQSSEYWAQKVRELSIDLEKQRQVPRAVD